MTGQVISKIFDLLEKHHTRKLRVEVKATATFDIALIETTGCPGVILTVCNKGERKARIKGLRVGVRGKGFLTQFQQGFNNSLGHVPSNKPELQEEELLISCLPLDNPNSPHGWSLETDEVCRFFFPVDEKTSAPVATYRGDAVTAKLMLFDGEEFDVLNGEELQSMVQPLLDFTVENKLACRVRHEISIKVRTEDFPNSIEQVGKVNIKPVSVPVGEPWASDDSVSTKAQ